jgi:hypothetical protein
MLFYLEYVTEVIFIPNLKSLFEVIKSLLETIHFLAMIDCSIPPPGIGHGLELWMGMIKMLKYEGISVGRT